MTATMNPNTNNNKLNFDSQHEDMIHDVQLDYYGKRLATCSSDRTIRLFQIDGEKHTLIQVLNGHEGPVWQISWAHPKFGNILASCSYDSKVLIWKEVNGVWSVIKEHNVHTSSVNSIAWAPHELGPILAAASSDGKVSVLTYKEDTTWETSVFDAHAIGCNAISWASPYPPNSLNQPQSTPLQMRFATAGCDNLVKVWSWKEGLNAWKEEDEVLDGHTDWVRDVAFAPSLGQSKTWLASCSQDKSVLLWSQDNVNSKWVKQPLKQEPFQDVVWRLSWASTGNLLAVSIGDNTVELWKPNNEGVWEKVETVSEN